jgi:hypothetical protein
MLGAVACAILGCGSEPSAPEVTAPRPEAPAPGIPVTPPASDPLASGVIVSAPIARNSGGNSSSADTVAYVSAAPGSVPGAVAASVGTRGTVAQSLAAIEGGFDPVSLHANAGDEVTVVVIDSAGATTTITSTVKSGQRPRVVRTSPGPRHTDIPLNAVIKVVFSTPIAPENVAAGVHLMRDDDLVSTTVISSADGLVYDLVPASPLAPGTNYQVVVSGDVADMNGTLLGQEVTSTFTTITTQADPPPNVPLPASFQTFWPNGMWLEQALPVGGTSLLTVMAPGGTERYPAFAGQGWTSDAPAISSVSQVAGKTAVGEVSALQPGRARITFTALGSDVTMEQVVFGPLPPSTLASVRVLISRGGQLVVMNGDGTNQSAISTPGPAYMPSVAGDGRIVYSTAPLHVANTISSAATIGGVLYVREVSGAVRQLTSGAGVATCPAWSPDGLRVAYSLSVGPMSEWGKGPTQLRVVNGDGSGDRLLADGREPVCPHWHPNGTSIAFSGVEGPDADSEFYVVNSIDVESGQVSHLNPALWHAGPWAPDGSFMLSESSGKRLDIGANVVMDLYFGAASVAFMNARWTSLSSDGQLVMYVQQRIRTSDAVLEIWLATPDGLFRSKLMEMPYAAEVPGQAFMP